MGFKAPRSVYRLDFAGTELEGLEVRMRGGRLGDALGAAGLVGVTEANATVDDVKLAMSQYEELADHIISWNLEDDDEKAIAPDLDGLGTLEMRHVNMIAAAWQKAQVDVPGPLPRVSKSSPEPDLSSIRMEALPASLAS